MANLQSTELGPTRWRWDVKIGLGYLLVAILTQIGLGTVVFWPAAGVAIAGAALVGSRAWLVVFLGSIASNVFWALLTGGNLLSWSGLVAIVGIAAGNALATVGCAWGLQTSLGDRDPFSKPLDSFRFCLWGAGTYALVSASFATLITSLRAEVWTAPLTAFNWFAGDLISGIVAATPILLWRQGNLRLKADERLVRAEAEFTEAQRLAHVGSWHWDSKTDVITGSDELLRIHGLDPAKDRMPTFREQDGVMYPHESWERVNAAVQETVRTGVGYELDVHALCRGAPIWVTARGEVVRDGEGRILALRGTVEDITDRKSREERIAKLTRLYAVLSHVNEAIVRARDAESLYVDACRILAEHGGFPLAWIGQAKEQRLVPLAAWGTAAGDSPLVGQEKPSN